MLGEDMDMEMDDDDVEPVLSKKQNQAFEVVSEEVRSTSRSHTEKR